MSTRSIEQVLGSDVWLWCDKADNDTKVAVGCVDSITMKTDKGANLEYSCRSGTGKLPSGKDPITSVSITGVTHFYATGNVANQVSFQELEGYCAEGTVKQFWVGGKHTGDPLFTATFAISSVTLEAKEGEVCTYSMEMESTAKRTTATQA